MKSKKKTGGALDGIYKAMTDAIRHTLGEFELLDTHENKGNEDQVEMLGENCN